MDWAPPRTADNAWIVVLTILFWGCWAVSVEPPVWTWKRHFKAFSLVTLNLVFIIDAQISLAALNLAISSKNPLWALKKKEILEPKTFASKPFLIAVSTYVMAFANVNANSWTKDDPASLIWYPDIDIVFHLGIFSEQNSKISEIILSEWPGG